MQPQGEEESEQEDSQEQRPYGTFLCKGLKGNPQGQSIRMIRKLLEF